MKIQPEGLAALLAVPALASGLVIFAHGSGSGRLSPRNNEVADTLHRAGFATLLLDLLTGDEEADRSKVFDIPLLAARLLSATRWARIRPETERLPAGYFGASTGAAAALLAATAPDGHVSAIVSRGGRPDLAGARALQQVRAPTLLIVGSLDVQVVALNRIALSHLRTEKELRIVPGAHHLFEEPGAMMQVAADAVEWFQRHMAGDRT